MSKYIKPWCPLLFDLRSTNTPIGRMTSTSRPHVFPRQRCRTAIDDLSAQRPSTSRIPCVRVDLAVWILRLLTKTLPSIAKSITQLILCQVTTSEVEAATNLLNKAFQKLQGIQNFPSQRVADLEAAIRQLRQIGCILDSCTISASYEVWKFGPLWVQLGIGAT